MPEPSSLPTWARPDKKKPGRLATLIGIAVVIVVAILIGLGLTLLNGSRNGGGQAGGGGGGFGGGRRQPITVGTAKAVMGQIPITLDALGTVTPPVTATITSRISGNLMSVNFKEGEMVKKGQVLAQIDPRPYKVALEQARATQAHDEALLNNAKVDLVRYQTLLKQNSIASQQVDTQAALVKQDEAQVQADKAGVDNAKLNLDYTTITAPVAGRVGLRQVDVGNYVSAGSTTGLVVLTVVNPMDVEFAIPEDNIPRIQARQQRGASLTATALSRDGTQDLATGELSTLDTQIDVTTGTVKAKARFENDSFTLFPQQFVNVHLLVDTLCNQIIVPTTAVRHGSTGDYVFTINTDKTAKVQYVKTGPGTPETISIQSGVQAGQTVITEGGDRLRDGSPVLLPGDDPAKFQAAQQRAGRRGRGGQSGQHRGGGGRRGGQGGGQPGANAGAGGYGQGAQGAGAPGSPPTDAQSGGAGAAQAQQQQRDLADASCDAQGGRGQGGGFGGHGRHGQGGGQGQGGRGVQGPGQTPGGDQPVSAPPGQGQWRRHQGGQGSNTGAGNGQNGAGQDNQGQGGQGQGGHRHRRGQDNGQAAPAAGGTAG